MELLRMYVVVASVYGAIWCATDDFFRKNELFQEHLQRVRELPCETPQKRVVYLRELVSDQQWEEKYKDKVNTILPYGTVLGRCEHSGCCLAYNERCEPFKEENVSLTFAILDGVVRHFTIQAKNHTQCSCQKISDKLIKK